MNLGELEENVYSKVRRDEKGNDVITREQVKKVISCAIKEIENGIKKDKEVKIKDFGTFSVRRKRGREINNDMVSGMRVPAHNVVHFKVAERIKKEIW